MAWVPGHRPSRRNARNTQSLARVAEQSGALRVLGEVQKFFNEPDCIYAFDRLPCNHFPQAHYCGFSHPPGH